MRAASARSTIARSRWPRARWTRPNSPPFSARPAATSPPSALLGRCTTSAWTGAISTSCWPPVPRAYGELKNLCVWVKDNAGMGSLYRSQHELVLVFKQRGGAHRNNVQLGQFGRNRSNVWHYPGANSFARCGAEGNLLALHPTVKPVAHGRRCDPRLLRARRDRARRLSRQRHDGDRRRAHRPALLRAGARSRSMSTPPFAAGRR